MQAEREEAARREAEAEAAQLLLQRLPGTAVVAELTLRGADDGAVSASGFARGLALALLGIDAPKRPVSKSVGAFLSKRRAAQAQEQEQVYRREQELVRLTSERIEVVRVHRWSDSIDRFGLRQELLQYHAASSWGLQPMARHQLSHHRDTGCTCTEVDPGPPPRYVTLR